MSLPKALLQIGPLIVAAASWTPVSAADVPAQRRLAIQLIRGAAAALETAPLTVEAVEGALVILEYATEVDPDNTELWRYFLKLADLAERDDLRHRALGRLLQLDPEDDVVRLLYFNDAIDRCQTVEDRINAYKILLAEENRATLGEAVASRLCADLAFLLKRSGDVDGFARWLAEAVALDPANRTAAATAAGFFRSNVDDVYGEAELLAALVLVDPTAYDTHAVLAELLLEHGAYRGADRMYELAARTFAKSGVPAPDGMLADRAVAQWGRGHVDEALRNVRERQINLDEQYRRQLQSERPEMTVLDRAREHAFIASTLATVRAAIHNRLGNDQAAPTLRSALSAYIAEIATMKTGDDPDRDAIATLSLEGAWTALWLGAGIDEAGKFLEAAAAHIDGGELSAAAQARFDGWIALRSNDDERAIELLEPIAETDDVAKLGWALALRSKGLEQSAARGFHAIASRNPGSLMGVWARDVLAEMLGPLPPSREVARLEELVDSMPSIFFRLPDEPALAMGVRVRPTKPTFGPYEPVTVNIEITNNASFPLAIDPRGPIRPQVAVLLAARISRMQDIGDLRPLIVDIDRRLRLEPGQRLVIPVDLRRSVLGHVLNIVPLRGATLQVKVVSNFGLTGAKVIRPGMLGTEVEAPPIRIDGIRVTTEMVHRAIGEVIEPDSPEDLVKVALLAHLVTNLARDAGDSIFAGASRAEVRQLSDDAIAAITEAYTKLDPISQAWLVAVIPRDGPFEAMHGMAQKSQDKHVRMSYLLFGLTGDDDPMIDAALRGDDPQVSGVARLMRYARTRAAAAGPP